MFLFLLGICLEVELLGYVVTQYSVIQGTPDCFQSGYTISHSHHQCMRFPISLPKQIIVTLSLFLWRTKVPLPVVFFILFIPVGVKWYLIVVLI